MGRIKSLSILACIVAIVLSSAGTTLASAPANDNCANAATVGNVINQAFDTTDATFDGPGLYVTSPNIWYKYTATCNGCATISLCGSSFDTRLAVYSSTTCPPTLANMIEWDDDYCGHQSQVKVPVTSGHTYLIEVGGWDSYKGTGKLTISCSAASCYAFNDNCANAKVVGNVVNLPFDTIRATYDTGYSFGPNLWYRYKATATGPVTVSLCGSTYDTMLAVYDGILCPPTTMLAYNDDNTDVNIPCGTFDSKVTFSAVNGHEYLIEVGGNYDDGPGFLTIKTGSGGGCAPVNDSYLNPTAVGNVTNLAFDTTCATHDGYGTCMPGANVWYLYTATCSGNVTVSLCGSSFDTMLAVYNTTPIISQVPGGCDDDGCGTPGGPSLLTFAATAGKQYLIEVGGYDSYKGPGLLTISSDCITNNDNCTNAETIGNETKSFNTATATYDGPGLIYGYTGPDVWYVYTAACTGNVTVNLCNSNFDTVLVVYNGSACNPTSGRIKAYDDDGCSYLGCGCGSKLTFAAIAGNQYLIEVGGWDTASGQGQITVSSSCTASKTDLGDAPDSTNNSGTSMTAYPKGGPMGVQAFYPTVFNDSTGHGPYGPKHLNSTLVATLGTGISRETEADSGSDEDTITNIIPSTNQSDNDLKDDSITFPLNMPKCNWSTFTYKVNVIDPNVDMWVNVWCDWNRDGDWDDDSTTDPNILICTNGYVSEWAVQNQYLFKGKLQAGLNTITTPAFLPWHPAIAPGPIWMRITLSDQPWKGGLYPGETGNAGSGPQAGYLYGETEDYYFTPKTASPNCPFCQDLNEDGVIDLNDWYELSSRWLSDCLGYPI
jgi:hypothetical protein